MITYTILGSTLSGSVKNINPTLGAAFFITSSTGEVFIKSGTAYLVTSTPTSLSVTEIENQALKFVASKAVYIPNGSNKYPKGMDLSLTTQDELTSILRLMNNRPRKCLGFKTPLEVMNDF